MSTGREREREEGSASARNGAIERDEERERERERERDRERERIYSSISSKLLHERPQCADQRRMQQPAAFSSGSNWDLLLKWHQVARSIHSITLPHLWTIPARQTVRVRPMYVGMSMGELMRMSGMSGMSGCLVMGLSMLRRPACSVDPQGLCFSTDA